MPPDFESIIVCLRGLPAQKDFAGVQLPCPNTARWFRADNRAARSYATISLVRYINRSATQTAGVKPYPDEGLAGDGIGEGAAGAFAVTEFVNGGSQVLDCKVGPALWREDELGEGAFP
jgi:hypothetical protein